MRVAVTRIVSKGGAWSVVIVLSLAALPGCCFLGIGRCGDSCTENPQAPSCVGTEVQGARTLSVAPIAQQTEVWCWAATAEMIFRHYGLPNLNPVNNYQCGIVAAYFGGNCAFNCFLCVAPIPGMSELHRVVTQYGLVSQSVGVPSPVLGARLLFRSLSMLEVKQEIDAGHPVAAGISAGGFPFPNLSQHVVVIVGYDAAGSQQSLIVNDPFPYNLPQFVAQGRVNPYFAAGAAEVQPGRYRIAYSAFTGFMAWGNSIDRIRIR
jgi:hypothetical protein